MIGSPFSRRQVLAGVGTGVAAGILVSNPALAASVARSPMVLLDRGLPAGLAAGLDGPARVLTHDLVREWRGGLGREIALSGAVAFTRWDKAVILQGLARENGHKVTQRRIGRSLFETRLG